ncbi:MAG: glutamate 5-kinase [Oscillospiraceae bacterium]|jgi:glutamate 5-kinase|nr:glutamate 5-kinase [Oscillospiraceae bacterium]
MIDLSGKKRVVIKVGTSNIAYKTGNLNIRRVEKLVKVISDIRNSGREVIFVTSGAISVGMGKMNIPNRPSDTPGKQACAAVGQSALMNIYDNEFAKYNRSVAQILMTRDVISNKERRQNVKNTIDRLLEMGVIPIINANDTVSLEELDFDENDTLSAMVAKLAEADLLIMFTDVDGLYDKSPSEPDAKLIPVVEKVTQEMIHAASGKGSELSSGGMLTKLEATILAKEDGIMSVILNGERLEILYDLFENKAVCTVFV